MIDYMLDHGASEPSSGAYHPGIWYSMVDADIDYETGAEKTLDFHPEGTTTEEDKIIFDSIKQGKNFAEEDE